MTKKCTKCGEEKDIKLFSLNGSKVDGHHSSCKSCHSVYLKKHYQANKAYYIERARVSKYDRHKGMRGKVYAYLLEHPCVDCGEADPVVLDFDHVRGQKEFSISGAVGRVYKPWPVIVEEIAKCDVRCANCHRRRTAKVQGWYGATQT